MRPNEKLRCDIYNEDCIAGMAARLEAETIDLCVSSIPFGALFMYSGKNEDIGNNQDGTDLRAGMFGLHLRFFIEQLFRVLKPGCNACIHIQQLLRYKNTHGYIGRRDFRGACIDMFEAGGFEWKGEFVIPKNPQIIAKRLNLHSLMFATGKRNGRDLAPAVNDYVLIFQKPGEAIPAPCLFDPRENPGGWVSQDEWIRDAHGVWSDIRETDVLEGWREAREEGDEKHVCPLQLEVIRRLIKLYSNPGEVVLDPFMGIGSSAYVALEQGRHTVGFELKETWAAQAQRNALLAVERAGMQTTIFDLMEPEEESEAAPVPEDVPAEEPAAPETPADWKEQVRALVMQAAALVPNTAHWRVKADLEGLNRFWLDIVPDPPYRKPRQNRQVLA